MDGYLTNGLAVWKLAIEAQTVIAYRGLGMMGLWPVTASENSTMVSEKLPAFMQANHAATMAAMSGKSPDKIMAAWLRPVSGRASANRLRLSKAR